MVRSLIFVLPLASTAFVIACGGGSSSKTATPTAGATREASPATAKSATAQPAAASATPSNNPPSAGSTAAASGKAYNLTQAQQLIADASLLPKDIGADWSIMSDTTTDNAAAAAADPTTAASNDRCGRLIGRTVTDQPKDVVSAYLTGLPVSYFSQLTVFATPGGALDCATEAATRFTAPGAFARAFGTLFINPDAVTVAPIDVPQQADGSFAAALTGDINASGTTVQLQIVVVAFRKGNVNGVVGMAQSPLTQPLVTPELRQFLDLVLQRVGAAQ